MFLRNLTLCALIASTSLHASHVLQQPDPTKTTLAAKVASDAAVKSQRSETHHTNVLQAIITFIHTCAIPIGATAIPATLSDARKVQQAEQQRAAQQALQQSLNSRNNTIRSITKYSRPR